MLLYTDRRMRAEAFDLVLQTGAAGARPPRRVHRQPLADAAEPNVPTIDIDRDAAHDAAQHELGKPIYPKASPTERLDAWLDELLYRLSEARSTIPGGWLTTTVLPILLVIAMVVAIQIARRTMRTNRGGDYELFDEHELSAQHRTTAQGYAAEGNWTAAIRAPAESRRASTRGERRARPGSWPNRDRAGPRRWAALPSATELTQAATAFNDVTYGERPGTQAAYQMIADLDDHLRARTSGSGGTAALSATSDGWAEVR